MIAMEVSEENGFQSGEIESRVGERGRRAATAVDDEDPSVDDER